METKLPIATARGKYLIVFGCFFTHKNPQRKQLSSPFLPLYAVIHFSLLSLPPLSLDPYVPPSPPLSPVRGSPKARPIQLPIVYNDVKVGGGFPSRLWDLLAPRGAVCRWTQGPGGSRETNTISPVSEAPPQRGLLEEPRPAVIYEISGPTGAGRVITL